MDHVRLSDFNCIPEFHGYRQDVGMPALQWLQRFEKLATMVQWTEPQWLTVASLRSGFGDDWAQHADHGWNLGVHGLGHANLPLSCGCRRRWHAKQAEMPEKPLSRIHSSSLSRPSSVSISLRGRSHLRYVGSIRGDFTRNVAAQIGTRSHCGWVHVGCPRATVIAARGRF